MYGDGKSLRAIQKALNIDHPYAVKRFLQQACYAISVTLSQQPSEGNRVIETVTKAQT
jgi:hypothetical protein